VIVASDTPEHKKALWQFLVAHGVTIPISSDFEAIGRLNSGGHLIAVVGYNGFNGRMCNIHVAGIGNWMSRNLIKNAFHFPFVQRGVRHIFATIAVNNPRSLRLNRRLGFRDILRIPDGYDIGIDTIVLKLSSEECKWTTEFERKAA
jgi:RimJ/RimL family protein N-acetyltransferase